MNQGDVPLNIRQAAIFAVPLAAGFLAGSLTVGEPPPSPPDGSGGWWGTGGNAPAVDESTHPHSAIHASDEIRGPARAEASLHEEIATAEDQLLLGPEWQSARELLDVGLYSDESLRTMAQNQDVPATIALLMRDRAHSVLTPKLRNEYLTRLVARGEMNALFMAALPGPNSSYLDDQAAYARLWGKLNPTRKPEFERLYEQIRYFALLSGKAIDTDSSKRLADRLETEIDALQ